MSDWYLSRLAQQDGYAPFPEQQQPPAWPEPQMPEQPVERDAFEAAALRTRAPYRNTAAVGSNRLGQLAEQLTSQPSWLERATEQSAKDQEAFKMGGVAGLMADTSVGQELAGGFGGTTKAVGKPVMGALADVAAPPFYSAAQRAVDSAKLSKGTPEQWLGYLRNQPGVKPEELERVFGNLPQGGPLTKPQMEAHAAENAVQLGEVNKGYGTPAADREVLADAHQAAVEAAYPYKQMIEEAQARGAPQAEIQRLYDASNAAWDHAQTVGRQLAKATEYVPTKFDQWQLPGGENYREKLLTLPDKGSAAVEAARTKADQLGRQTADAMSAWKALAESNPPGHPETLAAYQRVSALRREANAAFEQAKELSIVNRDANFKSSHWDEPNVLAHMRMNDREVPGVGKSLHLEEIQSDWHQKGRQQGYQNPNPTYTLEGNGPWVIRDNAGRFIQDFNNRQAAEAQLASYQSGRVDPGQPGVPDAPFKSTWSDVALKRSIRDAAEGGYDALSWTPGEAQAARYDLSKHIDSIHYDQGEGTLVATDKNGRQVLREYTDATPEAFEPHIGKEPAKKLHDAIKSHEYDRSQWEPYQNEKGRWEISDPNGETLHDYGGEPVEYRTHGEASEHIDDMLLRDAAQHGSGHPEITGLDLKVGGEGMKAFYDKMLVDKANALGKKHGARVEQAEIDTKPERGPVPEGSHDFSRKAPVHVLRITPQLREAAMKGFPLFTAAGGVMGGLAAQDNYE